MNPAILAGLGAVVFLALKPQTAQAATDKGKAMTLNLKHFSPDEFRQWWPDMSPDLLRKLDAFREAWGHPVQVSPAGGAIGRHLGDHDDSQHNIDRWGEVRGIDVFPKLPDGQGGYRYLDSPADRDRAYRIARRVGFTGVGLYTDTTPGNMLHVDVRRSTGRVATWSRIDGSYLDIGSVLA